MGIRHGRLGRGAGWRALLLAAALVAAGTAARAGIVGAHITYTIRAGDTLLQVAARVGADVRTIAAENHLDPSRPLQVGLVLSIDARHIVPRGADGRTLTVNIPQRMVFLHDPDGTTGFPVAVGRPTWPTPTGAFTVIGHVEDPTWHVPPSIQEESRRLGRVQPPVVPPGPNNPLGKYWLGLSLEGIGIHATNAPSSIYRAATHGCIRVGEPHIRILFDRVSVGASGAVVYEPFLVEAAGDEVFLEVHPDVYRRFGADPLAHVRALVAEAGLSDHVDWTKVASVIAERAGVAREVTRRAPGSPDPRPADHRE